jgi:hypothetical protein
MPKLIKKIISGEKYPCPVLIVRREQPIFPNHLFGIYKSDRKMV